MAADVSSQKMTRAERKAFEAKLFKGYGLFFLALLLVIGIIMYLEIGAGLGNTAEGRRFIGIFFILLSFGLYAVVGIANFTKKFDEYYVAGRKVPAFFNGMATGADWMSAASFISMAGSIWLLGYDGLAYVMGWTGGYVMLALFFAPYIRKFGQFTIPDFVAARFAERGNAARLVAAICAIIVSFTYVTAQVTGVGMINLYNDKTNQLVGSITEADLQVLQDALEEESSEDRDYYIDQATMDVIGDGRATDHLLKVLRDALGTSDGIDIRWERS